MSDGDSVDRLAQLRSQVKPDSIEGAILSELAVIRAAMARLVMAVSGDPTVGVDGIIVTLKRHDRRVSDLEARAGETVIEAKTSRLSWERIVTIASTVAAIGGWAFALWDRIH